MQDLIAEIKKNCELENHYFILYKRSGYTDKKVLRLYQKVLRNYHKALYNLMLHESRLPDSERVHGLGFHSIKSFGKVRLNNIGEPYLTLSKPLTLYHVADAKNAASIIKTGLKPRFPGKHKRVQPETNMPRGVYLTNKKGIKIFKKIVEDPVVFMVKLSKGMKLWVDRLTCKDYYSKVAIASRRITKVNL